MHTPLQTPLPDRRDTQRQHAPEAHSQQQKRHIAKDPLRETHDFKAYKNRGEEEGDAQSRGLGGRVQDPEEDGLDERQDVLIEEGAHVVGVAEHGPDVWGCVLVDHAHDALDV